MTRSQAVAALLANWIASRTTESDLGRLIPSGEGHTVILDGEREAFTLKTDLKAGWVVEYRGQRGANWTTAEAARLAIEAAGEDDDEVY